MPKFFVILFFLSRLSLWAQNITVIDKTTQLAIEHVMIYEESGIKSVHTNKKGLADISIFNDESILLFQHPSYLKYLISKAEIVKSDSIIELQEKIFQFDEIVIAAGKWEQNKEEVPNEILAISKKEIQTAQAQTAADLLQKTGQVFVQKSQLGGGSPTLRGFAANRVLIVVDGVRMNNAIFRSGNLQNIISIDPNALQEAEIVFGPGSVIYGSDALGGVMDFHTITPEFSYDSLKVNSGIVTRYSSANHEKTGHIDLQVRGKNLTFVSSFSYSDFNDLEAGSSYNTTYGDFGKRFYYADRVNDVDILVPNESTNLQTGTGFSMWSTINKLRYRLNSNIELQYGLYHSNTSNVPRYDRLAQPSGEELRSSEWYYGPQKWTMHRIETRLLSKNKFYKEGKITVSYQIFEESRHDRKFNNNQLRHQLENVDVFTLNADFDKSFPKSELYYGLEASYNVVSSEAFRTDIVTSEITEVGSRYPNGGSEYNSAAAYLSYKYNLKKKLTATSGVRYNWVALNSSSTDIDAVNYGFDKFDLANNTINGSIGLAYLPVKTSKINFVAATGFRSPNIDDIGKVFELNAEDSIVIIPNPNLKPEYTYNLEIGLEQKIFNNIQFDIVGYYTYLTNAIVRGAIDVYGSNVIAINGIPSSIRAQINSNIAYIYGGSASFGVQLLKNLFLHSSYTMNRGWDHSNDEPLRHTTPDFGKTTISYKTEKINLQLYSEYNTARYRKDIPSSEIDDKSFLYAKHNWNSEKDGSPAWITYNIKGIYYLNSFVVLTAAIENITDLHYRPYSSGISAPGRNLVFSINARFPYTGVKLPD